MPKATPIFTNFTAGELSERLAGRVDIEKYFNAARTLYNMIIQPHGAATRRAGTRHIAEVRNSASSVRLIPFEFSNQQAYVIEVGHEYMRFFMDQGSIATPGSATTVYEIATTINQASLSHLKWAQSADEMYLVSDEGDMPPAVLTRTGHNAWAFNDITFTSDPFGGATGYPRTCGFFEQRSVWANVPSSPQRMWFSASGAYTDLTLGTGDDDAIDITIAADNVNPIMWIAPMRVMLFGTTGGEWRVASEGYTTPVSPTNVIVRRESNYGSEEILPEVVGPTVLYVQRHGRKVRELAYDYTIDGWDAPDLMLLAEHLTNQNANGATVRELAYCQEPDSILWGRREDGSFIGCTYNRMQSVAAWHHHETEGEIESICKIPGEGRDELWMAVQRTIGGSTYRHIECMQESDFLNAEDAWFLDDALRYSGSAATTITGLSHLNGASVGILADGAAVAQKTVNAGSIVLSNEASKVLVGLPYTSQLQTMRIEGGSALGTSQTKKKKLAAVAVRLYRSAGFEVGASEDELDTVPIRTAGDAMDAHVPLKTGDIEVREFPGGWTRDGYIWVQQTQPLPLTVQAIVAMIETSDF